MGAVAAVIIFLWLLVMGLSGIAAGIVGLIVFGKMRKKGKKAGKPLTIVSAVVLAISIVITIIPVGFFSFIVAVNATPPDDFVETEIVIAENGYQDTCFTADGVVYEVLPWTVNYAAEDETPTAVFSYKEEGFMNRSQWGNYYLLENEPNFHLVYDEADLIFCPVSEKEQVVQYYQQEENLVWAYCDWQGERRELTTDAEIAMKAFRALDVTALEKVQITSTEWEEDEFLVDTISKDETILIASDFFLYKDGVLYYICDSVYYEETTEYTLVVLPEAIAEPLLSAHKIG